MHRGERMRVSSCVLQPLRSTIAMVSLIFVCGIACHSTSNRQHKGKMKCLAFSPTSMFSDYSYGPGRSVKNVQKNCIYGLDGWNFELLPATDKQVSSSRSNRVYMGIPSQHGTRSARQEETTRQLETRQNKILRQTDPEIADLLLLEEGRQRDGLELIASENFASAAVRAVLGSCLTNKYSEGQVGKRYYGGNEYIDKIETLCMERALKLYGLNAEEWGVNVQPYSGSPANFAAYTALLKPHDRIMGLDLPSGGHLTHGFQTPNRKVSATSVYFESMPYVVSEETGLIDYEDLEKRATMFMPKLLIAGASAYPREWDYARMRQIADKAGAYLLTDMAHISGLVAANCAASPFPYSDVVTSTTHKSLRGPRSGIIFAKRGELMDRIDKAVFPALQGGPHNHQIGALAVALKEADTDEFKMYATQIIQNARALADGLLKLGHTIATGGTDNHLLLWDARPLGITGSKLEKILERVGITTNKNSLRGDVSAINPGGVRLGTPALTSRGFMQSDFDRVADFLHQGSELAIEVQTIAAQKKNRGEKVLMKDFIHIIDTDETIISRIANLRNTVETFSHEFPIPGDLM